MGQQTRVSSSSAQKTMASLASRVKLSSGKTLENGVRRDAQHLAVPQLLFGEAECADVGLGGIAFLHEADIPVPDHRLDLDACRPA
jgi:hypothetical protein